MYAVDSTDALVEEVVVEVLSAVGCVIVVHGTPHSTGQCLRANAPSVPPNVQSSIGIREPQLAASLTPLQLPGTYSDVVAVAVAVVVSDSELDVASGMLDDVVFKVVVAGAVSVVVSGSAQPMPQNKGQYSLAKSPSGPNNVQSDCGIREPHAAASFTPLQLPGTYTVVICCTVTSMVDPVVVEMVVVVVVVVVVDVVVVVVVVVIGHSPAPG